ncbi:hypothetical protein MARPO_0058s0057 [Marchantia polymorpha]|uniref:Uncharacterized protein n=1 Tax=Marchantia polymorpha TaxID=3197 RepID=A0A2R6WTV8_MARPO|nr:hypothetical protein MARPO_0058s0057 [Marchantia polymorpha]|eukprot:PTQ37269.1 hypothetical protein MARPO_0058s0057 [Marchantia polymorpha]
MEDVVGGASSQPEVAVRAPPSTVPRGRRHRKAQTEFVEALERPKSRIAASRSFIRQIAQWGRSNPKAAIDLSLSRRHVRAQLPLPFRFAFSRQHLPPSAGRSSDCRCDDSCTPYRGFEGCFTFLPIGFGRRIDVH